MCMPAKTADKSRRVLRVAAVDRSDPLTTFAIGEKRSMTPEGFMLCKDVPVSRTGTQEYSALDIAVAQAVEPGPDGMIYIERTPEEVFRPETLASFEGKPVTLSHPDEFVTPENYNDLAMGHMFNVRRGENEQSDLTIADLLITNQKAIDAINGDERKPGIREVSLGYESDYESVVPGRGAQRNISGNHIALVERGRCGPRCAIGDQDMAKKVSFGDRLRRAFLSKDAEEIEKLAKEKETDDEESESEKKEREEKGSKSKTGDALNQILSRLKSLDERMEKLESEDDDEKEEEEEEKRRKKKESEDLDSTEMDEHGAKLYTGDAAKHILARAEILSPGFKLPTFDAKTTDLQKAAALCGCQRKALDAAYATDDGKKAIDSILAGQTKNFDKLPPAVVNMAFNGAAEIMRSSNNAGHRVANVASNDATSVVDAMQASHNKFWAARGIRN